MLLVLLERWCYIPFGSRQGLPALVVGRNEVDVAVRHFYEVAEHLVVSDLERADARARALLGLDFRDTIFPAVTQRSPFVESGVDAITDARLVSDGDRWPLDKYAPNFLTEIDRKSTRLNSSHGYISYAVFCLKKKITII